MASNSSRKPKNSFALFACPLLNRGAERALSLNDHGSWTRPFPFASRASHARSFRARLEHIGAVWVSPRPNTQSCATHRFRLWLGLGHFTIPCDVLAAEVDCCRAYLTSSYLNKTELQLAYQSQLPPGQAACQFACRYIVHMAVRQKAWD